MENINVLRDEAYQIAVAHGWHDEPQPDRHFLMLIICELAEAIEADRKNKHAVTDQFRYRLEYGLREEHLSGEAYERFYDRAFEDYIKDSVEDELADVVIRCLDLAGLRNLDLEIDVFKEWDTYKGVSKEDLFKDKSLTIFAYDIVVELLSLTHFTVGRWTLINTIALIDAYCGYHGISLEWHVKEKVKYNKGREYKHGKRY